MTVTYTATAPPPFFLLITEPVNLTIVAAEPVPLAGRTRPGSRVTVNGVGVSVNGIGEFTTLVQLDRGTNNIDVRAISNDGKLLTSNISVIYVPQ